MFFFTLCNIPYLFVYRYRQSITAAKSLYGGSCQRKPLKVYWFWGETGAGKSYRAEQEASDDGRRLYRQNGSAWWDGYDGDELVIIDDLDETAKFRDLLKILDVYNVLVPTKGSHQWLKAEIIWVTASYHPDKIDQGGQLLRRCTEVVNMKRADRPDILQQLMGRVIVAEVGNDELRRRVLNNEPLLVPRDYNNDNQMD